MNVAVLINYIPPYRVPLFRSLADQVDRLRIFVSVPMEPNREWMVNWGNLDVQIQKNIMIPYTWKHPKGFSETLYLHFPYNTIPSLYKYAPDVIITAEMGFRSFQALLYKKILRTTKLILWAAVSEYTETGRDWFRKKIRSAMIASADSVLVNGESGARYITKLGYNTTKIVRVPYTTDFDRFQSVNAILHGEKTRVLLYVGRLEPRKGLIPFLKSLSTWCIAHPDYLIKWIIAGDGLLENEIKTYSVPDNLTLNLLGNVAYEELPKVYQSADIFVFPTLADEWGMVVSEAMASSIPVLGSIYSQAVEELVVEGKTGWTFRPDHFDEMTEKIDRALLNPQELLIEMGKTAQVAVAHHTPEYASKQMVKAIHLAVEKLP